MFPPPPAGVCPASAVSSFSACIPRGAECGKNEFPPGLLAPRRHGSLPDAACAAPRLPTPAALRVPPDRQQAGAGGVGLAAGAPQPSRTPAALGRDPACSGGIRLAGRIRARESSSPDSRANKKHQLLLAPPAPRRSPEETAFCRNATSSTRDSLSSQRLLIWLHELGLRRSGPATRTKGGGRAGLSPREVRKRPF